MSETKKYQIGVDIGGTNMKAALWDGEKVLETYTLSTPKDNLEHFLIMLKALIEPLLEKAGEEKGKVSGLGLAVAALYDNQGRRIIKAPNIPMLDGVDLASQVEKKFEMTTKIDNDVNCFLRAEVKMGAAKKHDNVFGLTIGTGIGGGWWVSGEIYKGHHGGAGEIGRMIVVAPQELEAIYQKLNQGNSANLAEEAYRGDDLAQKSYEEIGYYIGAACANIINLIDPEAIVIGGGTMEADDLFFSKIKKTVQELAMHPEAKKIKILKAKLGVEVGAIGAALQME